MALVDSMIPPTPGLRRTIWPYAEFRSVFWCEKGNLRRVERRFENDEKGFDGLPSEWCMNHATGCDRHSRSTLAKNPHR